ncbi:MAG: ABC transporter ATP-binding protein [Spirochaetales bacterium]|nr:ABC transporter ATP-binding protein [Spirochaetales bacterium]
MILEVDNLEFSYSNVDVIRDVSFMVEEGEIVSILGPNGTGKTTLLKCLNRILEPKNGCVIVDGHDAAVLGHINLSRKIGWVPQHGNASRMKVYDLILLGRKPYFRWSPSIEDYKKVEEAICLMGIEELSMRYADEISGGEFQLVQIVRALAQNPRVILFDEPTSSLDIAHQHQLMTRIRTLIHSSPMAAVLTMHDLNLALRYCDKFILLKDGHIFASGGRDIINSENIREVYNMEADIIEAGGFPLVVPV